jgi:hypothetical protein
MRAAASVADTKVERTARTKTFYAQYTTLGKIPYGVPLKKTC